MLGFVVLQLGRCVSQDVLQVGEVHEGVREECQSLSLTREQNTAVKMGQAGPSVVLGVVMGEGFE